LISGPDHFRPVAQLPPPPELQSQGSLVWRTPTGSRPNRPLPAHPLLLLADPPEAPAPRPFGWLPLRSVWPGPIRGKLLRSAPEAPASPGLGGPRSALFSQIGRPPEKLVVVVLGGRGGAGRSTLAANLAYAFSRGQESRRVLLVDADGVDPDLDLRLGARRSGRDLAPLARVDQLVLRLSELREGAASLDGCLFTTPELGFQCLLAGADEQRSVRVGREHLDYLFEHLLQPAFQVMIVDGGRCPGPDSVALRFWLEKASVALIPTAMGESHQRNCARTVTYVEQNSALGRGDCLAVATMDSDFRELRRQLSQQGMEVVAVPWNRKAARLADAQHLPSAHVDPGMRSASLALADQLSRIAARRVVGGL
jgi:septum formation inhibitor-activating ATPase MinD